MTAVLIGFGLTGQFVYPCLQKKWGEILVLDPYPVSAFYASDSEKKSLPFDPVALSTSRSQRFGRWVAPDVDFKFFEEQGVCLERATACDTFSQISKDPRLMPRTRLSAFPWRTDVAVQRQIVTALRPNGNRVHVVTDTQVYDAERVILTPPPETVWRLLQSFDDNLRSAKAQFQEHAVRSLLVFSQSPSQKASQSAFYGPVEFDEGFGVGVECLGPFPWSDLSDASQAQLKGLGFQGASYRMLHFFVSGPFVTFDNGQRHWNFCLPQPQRLEECIDDFLKRFAEPGDEAILLRDFSHDPGVFHQSSLRTTAPLFSSQGICLRAPQIQILGSSLLPRLRGVHPTSDILHLSFNALRCSR